MTLFSTFTHPFFTELHKDWYIQQDGKYIKALPANMNELLTPRAIAYWISGDGSFNKNKEYIVISTESFTPRRFTLYAPFSLIDMVLNLLAVLRIKLRNSI
jgi:hypothetical protein